MNRYWVKYNAKVKNTLIYGYVAVNVYVDEFCSAEDIVNLIIKDIAKQKYVKEGNIEVEYIFKL